MRTKIKDEKIFAWTIFSMIFLAFIAFSAILLPKNLAWIIYIILIFSLYFVYLRLIVPVMNWGDKWWSLKSKKLILNKDYVLNKIGEPEVIIMAFLLDGKYNQYTRADCKDGFIITGDKFGEGVLNNINIKVKYNKDGLKIKFFRLSKVASNEIKRMEQYLKSKD